MKTKIKDLSKFLIIMIVFTIILSIPYLNKKAVSAHDISYHVNRIVRIGEELKNRQIPVQIHSNLLNGLGYANSLFYPELFLYIPAVLYDLGINVFTSYKLLMISFNFLTLVISCYAAYGITKKKMPSMLISILYSSNMYRITNIYARGAIGEVLAITFIPLIIYGLYDIIYGDNKRLYLIPLGFFGIISSHVLSYAIVAVAVAIISIINIVRLFKDKKRLVSLVIAGIFSILVAASFIFPYIEQSNNDLYNFENNSYNYDFMTLYGTTFKEFASMKFEPNSNYKSVGLFIFIASFALFATKKSETKKYMLELFYISIVLTIFSMQFIPWDKILGILPFLDIIQFPYRLTIVSSSFLSIIAGWALCEIFDNKKKVLYILSACYLLYICIFIFSIDCNWRDLDFDKVISSCPTGNSEYSPAGLVETDISLYTLQKPEEVLEFTRRGPKIEFTYVADEDKTEFNMPLTYYKGYRAYIETPDNGRINLDVSENIANKHVLVTMNEKLSGTVVVKYQMTAACFDGYVITFISVFTIIMFMIGCFIWDNSKKVKAYREKYNIVEIWDLKKVLKNK